MKLNKFAILLIFFCIEASAKNLCLKNEKTIFSFETKANKLLSLCEGSDGNYLTYKFGTVEKIELQFPPRLDPTSWTKFEFSGTSRGGGEQNAGFGDYSLSFNNRNSEYIVFQQWSYEDDSYSIGVTITGPKKPITINGIKKSQEGSLVLLENKGQRLRNTASPEN